MKHNIVCLIICAVPFLFAGCLRTYYPAIYQSSSMPLIYESPDSTKQRGKYFGADLVISKNDDDESIQLLKGSYTIVDTRDHFNFNPRIFGYVGNYKVAGLQKYNGNKPVFGIGTELVTSLNLKINALKVGLGFNVGAAAEFGDYYDFRRKARSQNLIESDYGLIVGMFSAFPVISYEFSKSTIFSAQANLGFPGFLSPSLVLNNDGYVYWLSWIPDNENKGDILGHRLVLGFMINMKNL